MSIKKELIKALKSLTAIYFGKVYTPDELKVSAKEIGGKVEMIQADGTLAPAPDGEYAMEDGTSFTVKDGVIETLVGQDAPANDMAEVPAEVDAAIVDAPEATPESPAEDTSPEDAVDMEARISALEGSIAELAKKLDECMANMGNMESQKLESAKEIEAFNKTVQELNTNIQTLAKVPVEFSKTNKKVVVEETKQDQLFELAKLIGRVK